MINLGLIGYPLGHSLSPKIQNAALNSCGLDGSYSLFPVHPDDKQGLNELLACVRKGEIAGVNVTIPHKQNVIEFLDELTPTAKAIGAVNTIYWQNSSLVGDNTDASGFLTDLKRFLQQAPSKLEDRKSAIVLGAGGSARAVVYALLNDGWNVTVAARRMEQARGLADTFANYQLPLTARSLSDLETHPTSLQSLLSNLSLIVNTTPVGMTPNASHSPWPEKVAFPPRAAIYDLVYNPSETRLVKDARAQGLPATTGLGMLIEQAALAFEIWTGHKPSREALFEAANQPAH